MMNKLTFVFAALLVAAVYSAPENFLKSLKSLHHLKRAETLMKPLYTLAQQKREMSDMELMMLLADQDHDNMLDANELKVMLQFTGSTPSEIEQLVVVLMTFDADKNGKLDIKEMEGLSSLGM